MTAPDDEWPIHPDNEWPARPDPGAEKALYAPPDKQPKSPRDWKHIIKAYIENENDHPDYHKKLQEAKPRRALITDDQPPIIDMSTHHDRHDIDDGSWPVLQHKAPKPTFDVYDPDKQYWPHNPLSEESTVYEKLRRLSWITGISMLWLLVISVLIGFSYPDEPGLAEVQLMGAIACGFFFLVAYSEQLFIGGDR